MSSFQPILDLKGSWESLWGAHWSDTKHSLTTPVCCIWEMIHMYTGISHHTWIRISHVRCKQTSDYKCFLFKITNFSPEGNTIKSIQIHFCTVKCSCSCAEGQNRLPVTQQCKRQGLEHTTLRYTNLMYIHCQEFIDLRKPRPPSYPGLGVSVHVHQQRLFKF